jgi:hypothetical protein
VPNRALNSAGTWIVSRVSSGPASSRSTRTEGSSVRRFASTQPALPAPTMTKSNVSADRIDGVEVMAGTVIYLSALAIRW